MSTSVHACHFDIVTTLTCLHVAGVILNHMLPVWLITIGLVCFLSYLTCKTAAKGLKLYRIECKPPPAGSLELHLIQIDQQDAERANSVHNLLRSVSDELSMPGSKAASTVSAMATDYEPTRPDSSLRAANLKAVSTSQDLAVAMPLASHADVTSDINWDLNMDKTKAEVPFQPSLTNSSAQSLRIRAESDSEPFTPFTPDASQAELALEPSPRQQTCSSSDDFEASQASSNHSADDAAPLLSHDTDSGNSSHGRGTTGKGSLTTWALQQPAKTERSTLRWSDQCTDALKQLPGRKLLAALVMWLVFAAFQLAKGQTRQCSAAYWVLYTLQAVALLGASAFFVHLASQEQQSSTLGGSFTASEQQYQQQQQQQTQWSRTTLTVASAVGVCGGALAAILGMGGGVIMGPLLLTLQVHPLATAATSILMILFSSSAATLSFAVNGNINAQYAYIYGSCNFVSSFAGVFIIGRIVRKTGKSFVVVMLLALVMATGAMASAVFGGQESVHDYRSGTNLTFNSMCTTGR